MKLQIQSSEKLKKFKLLEEFLLMISHNLPLSGVTETVCLIANTYNASFTSIHANIIKLSI